MQHCACSIASRLLLLSLIGVGQCQQTIIQTFQGEVGAGNSTFFTLKKEGSVTLILDSTEGDADIYISDQTMRPDFDDYDLQSTTCGKDIVTIPSCYKRPIGIAIYGHIYSALSKYTVTVVMDYAGSAKEGSGHDSHDGVEHEESLFWMIFVNVLKVIFEIIV